MSDTPSSPKPLTSNPMPATPPPNVIAVGIRENTKRVVEPLVSITIAGISFDRYHYDERGDVLYLNVGEPRPAARGLETPDGHAIHYGETGVVIGLTLLNVRHTLERDGRLTLTLPPEHLEADALKPILQAA